MASNQFYAIIAGAGSGIGRAVAAKFAKRYTVVLLARKRESFDETVDQINAQGGSAIGIATDVTDPLSLDSTIETIRQTLPNRQLVAAIYNVNTSFMRKGFLELKVTDLDEHLNAGPRGAFIFSQKVLPLLLEAVPRSLYPPTLIFTGATASVRGSARFAHFAAGKFGLRALGQSLAREFHPHGIHIAHSIVDGGVDTPQRRALIGVEAPDTSIKPEQIADDYWHLHTQHRSGFTQEIDTRPYVEKF